MSRDRLLEGLKEHSYTEGTFKLASGKESDFYINCKRTFLSKQYIKFTAAVLSRVVRRLAPEVVAGEGLGGIPLATAVATYSMMSFDLVLVRSAEKDHGTKGRIEAPTIHGKKTVLIEDVLTTGGSALRAINFLSSQNYKVSHVVALVDREEGATEYLQSKGIEAISIFSRSDFLSAR